MAEKILDPMKAKIEQQGGKILGAHAVEDVLLDQSTGAIKGVMCNAWQEGKKVALEADAVIFSVGTCARDLRPK